MTMLASYRGTAVRAELLQDHPPGKLFQHWKGGVYRILAIALNEGNFEVDVCYTDISGHAWVRPAAEFFGMTLNDHAEAVPRFVAVGPLAPVPPIPALLPASDDDND